MFSILTCDIFTYLLYLMIYSSIYLCFRVFMFSFTGELSEGGWSSFCVKEIVSMIIFRKERSKRMFVRLYIYTCVNTVLRKKRLWVKKGGWGVIQSC